jgi:hypothetical protein
MAQILAEEKKFAAVARRQVNLALREIMSDPDTGLVLRRSAVVRLKKSILSKQAGKSRDLRVVLKHYRA